MSLINYADEFATLPNAAFTSLFSASQIYGAHELILPDHVSERCYYKMFSGCTSLTTAPELPATTLADFCYYNMFYGCTNLQTAP